MRVNADSKARHDVRYKRLARRLGISHADAFGRSIWVWFELYERAGAYLSAEDIDIAAEMDGFAAAMVECELAEETPDGIRVRGNERAGWVERKREISSEGGRARAAAAARKSGRFVKANTKHQPNTSRPPAATPAADQPCTSPPALALDPALALAPDQKTAPLAPLALTHTGPTPGSRLRAVFTEWFEKRYGAKYAWAGKEATHAMNLMGLAGDGGSEEVIRRAERAARQPWRKANVTLGTVFELWNSLASDAQPGDLKARSGQPAQSPSELAEEAQRDMAEEKRLGLR